MGCTYGTNVGNEKHTGFQLENLNGKTPRRPKKRWDDNIKMNLGKYEYLKLSGGSNRNLDKTNQRCMKNDTESIPNYVYFSC
jgi:hypothetical protein